MEIDVPYGETIVKIHVPDKQVLDVISPNKVKIEDERETLFNAISNPINSVSFQEFIADDK